MWLKLRSTLPIASTVVRKSVTAPTVPRLPNLISVTRCSMNSAAWGATAATCDTTKPTSVSRTPRACTSDTAIASSGIIESSVM
jgi:hypothetical protein